MAEGIAGGNCSQYWLEEDGAPMSENVQEKPPYHVPSMIEIAAIPWNGFTVASTFSGCGGSCLGYRMAGYRVLWANEFVPAAQDSYRANADSCCILDTRNIKTVQADDILQAIKLQRGDLDIFDGSPPCQAFSTAGKREKGWGQDKTYEHGAQQKNETLFTEYIRILRGLQPKVFVAENVSGLVKGVAKGYFKDILRDLRTSGYRVEARLLDAQWLGVPQMRQRIIFIGVRNDLGKAPAFPKPLHYQYSVQEALPWISEAGCAKHGFNSGVELRPDAPSPSVPASMGASFTGHWVVSHDESGQWSQGDITHQPAPTVRSARAGTMFVEGANGFNQHAGRSVDLGVPSPFGRRKFTIAELKRICAFPDDFILTGSYAQQWERLGNAVPPVMMFHIAEVIRQTIFDT